MTISTCVFDAYGTLFDVAAAAREAAAKPENTALAEAWPKLAAVWRDKQLQYTWLRAITDTHTDFWQVTEDALDWALEAMTLEDDALRAELLTLYRNLSAYPEVRDMLNTLKDRGYATAILSNGSPDMLDSAVTSAGIAGLLDAVLSVETVGVFKPDARVYDMVGTAFGTPRDTVLFVSSNGWDAAGAAGYGFQAVWVNHAGAPVDRLAARPDHILPNLTGLPDLVEQL